MKPLVVGAGGVNENPTIKGWQLVEEKSIGSGTSSVTFSNLDGDAAGEYMIEYGLNIVQNPGYAQTIHILPNNDSSTARRSGVMYRTAAGYYTTVLNYLVLYYSSYTLVNQFVQGVLFLNAATGFIRVGHGMYSSYGSDVAYLAAKFSTEWGDTSNNITSLVITADSGTFGGTGNYIRLYKGV